MKYDMTFKIPPIWILLLLMATHLVPIPAMAISEDEITEFLCPQCAAIAQINGELVTQIRTEDSEKQIHRTLETKYRAGIFAVSLSLIHISEPTRLGMISYAVF